ncbi:hypothetical protein JXC34_07230 [Candidatus Woesearchaeota archaeon]|nr:hypothetical protein [Candidatus Woesearchaeota archaeon]
MSDLLRKFFDQKNKILPAAEEFINELYEEACSRFSNKYGDRFFDEKTDQGIEAYVQAPIETGVLKIRPSGKADEDYFEISYLLYTQFIEVLGEKGYYETDSAKEIIMEYRCNNSTIPEPGTYTEVSMMTNEGNWDARTNNPLSILVDRLAPGINVRGKKIV